LFSTICGRGKGYHASSARPKIAEKSYGNVETAANTANPANKAIDRKITISALYLVVN